MISVTRLMILVTPPIDYGALLMILATLTMITAMLIMMLIDTVQH